MAEKLPGKMTPKQTQSYMQLVAKFPLVSIQSERQLRGAASVIDDLLKLGPLGAGQEVYLNALSDLVMVYENEHYPIPDVSGAEMLAHLIEARQLKQVDVSRGTGIAKSTIAQILAGKRRISQSHLGRLAQFFRMPASVFLPEAPKGQRPAAALGAG